MGSIFYDGRTIYMPSFEPMEGVMETKRFGFVIIKPDAVESGSIGKIIAEFEHYGFTIEELFKINLTEYQVLALYREHYGKDFYQRNQDFILSGPVVCMRLSLQADHDIVDDISLICGLTDPTDPTRGHTIRHKFGSELPKNAVHFSDNEKLADYDYAICCPKFMVVGI